MENSTNLYVRNLVDNIFTELTNKETKDSTVIRVNSENLAQNGEVSFLTDIRVWRGYVASNLTSESGPTTILEYYVRRKNLNTKELTDDEIIHEAFNQLKSKSQEWLLKINSYSLKKEKICIFLNRPQTLSLAIKSAVKNCISCGTRALGDRCFTLKVQIDKESELTNQRLNFIKDFTENILRLQGYNVSNKDGHQNYILTTKSEGIIKEGYKKFVCGVVKNPGTSTKETALTWKSYLSNKIEKLLEVNAHKYNSEGKEIGNHDKNVEEIAETVIKFELLSVKPSRAVFLKNVTTLDENIKGATFILYNTARIKAILKSYTEKELDGYYPKLFDIDNVDLSCLNQECEWNLVYTFILQYPQMIQSCVKHENSFEPYPQYVCSFLSRLCQQFSIYYRRTRILVKGYSHLMPIVMARIYLLQALLVVLENSLAVLGATSVTNM